MLAGLNTQLPKALTNLAGCATRIPEAHRPGPQRHRPDPAASAGGPELRDAGGLPAPGHFPGCGRAGRGGPEGRPGGQVSAGGGMGAHTSPTVGRGRGGDRSAQLGPAATGGARAGRGSVQLWLLLQPDRQADLCSGRARQGLLQGQWRSKAALTQ